MKTIHRYNTSFKFFFIPLFLIFTLISFTACENFLNSKDVMNEINKAIEYNNAKSYEIDVEADTGSGIVKTPATGAVEKKETDVFTVRFEPAEGYKFIKWEAQVKGMSTGEKAADYIEFENSDSLETKVTFKKASSSVIVIKAVCPPKLSYTIEPAESKTAPRDSSVILEFNQNLPANLALYPTAEAYITIQDLDKTGKDSSDYFKAPVVNGKKIKFLADTSNGYLSIPENTNSRWISVHIPKESIYYEYDKCVEPVRVYLDTDIDKTFYINSETAKKTEVKYSLPHTEDDETIGILTVNDTKFDDSTSYSYSVGQNVTLNYKLSKEDAVNYSFTEWKISHTYTNSANEAKTDILNLEEDSDDLEKLKISFSSEELTTTNNLPVYEVKLSVDTPLDGYLTIQPVVKYLEDVYLTLSGSHGKFTPNKGSQVYKIGKVNHIEYEPDSDYAFIRWQILNSKTGLELSEDEIAKYVEYDTLADEKTDIKFIALPQEDEELDFELRPLIVERPQVISNAPSYVAAGVYGNSTIRVMFDYEMDENSLYYTEQELVEIIRDGVDDLLTSGGGSTPKYYGYVKDGKTYFKNISIINSRNNANLADNFKAPVFENARTLSIPLKDGASLSAGLNVQVTIDKDFYRSQDNKKVSMGQSKKWLYLVNGKTDDEDPEIRFLVIKDSSETELEALSEEPTSSTIDSIKFFKKGEFYLGLEVHDNVAFTPSFSANLTKIFNSEYKPVSTPISVVRDINYSTSFGESAYYGEPEQDNITPFLSELTTLSDGVYSLSFTISDGSGNEATAPDDGKLYYFCLDSTPPDIAAPTVTDGSSAQSLNLSWDTTGVLDYKETVIRYRKWGSEDNYTSTDEVDGNSCEITGLTAGTRYEIIADYKDYAGNINSVPVSDGAYTRPETPKNVTLSATYGTSVTVTAEKPDEGNCTNIRIRYKVNGSSSWNEFGSRIEISEEVNSGSQTISPSKGYKWDFEVCTYDSESGKYSKPYYTSGTTLPLFTTVPNAVTLSSDSYTTNSVTINWTKPTYGNVTGYIVYLSTSSSFPNSGATVTKTLTVNSTVTCTFSDLTPGTTYYYKVLSYYESQTNTTATSYKSIATKCAAATGLSAKSDSNSSITLSWTKPEGNFSSYKLYYKKHSDSSFSAYGSINNSQITATVTGLSGGESYDFALYTIGSDSSLNNSVGITEIKNHPNPVQNLNAIKVSGSNKDYILSWTKPVSGEYDGYKYYTATSVSGLSSAAEKRVEKSSEDSSGNISLSNEAAENSVVYIKVVAYRTVGSNTLVTESTPICCSLALDSVQNLSATASSKNQINLSWTNPNPSGYDGIRIFKDSVLIAATDASGSTQTISKTANTFSVTGLTVNTNYDFTVTTYKKVTINGTATTLTADNIVSRYTLSNPLTSFTATAVGPKSVSLSWGYPTAGTYRSMYIYRGTTYVDYWSSQTSYTYSVPTGGTSYTFKGVTRNGNNVENTNEAKTYTLTTPPQPVTDLTATQNSSYPSTRIDLSWTKPGGNYTGVKVYYKLSSASSWTLFNTYANNSTTGCTVTGLTAGNTYDFYVESYLTNVSNIGDTSKATKTGVYAKPYTASLSVSSRTYNSITYSWSNPGGKVGGYYLYYKKSSDSSYNYVSLSSSATSYTLSSLSGGTIYDAYLVTYGSSTSNSTSSYSSSSPLKKATPLATPGSLSVSIDGTGTKVSWTAPANASSSTTTYYVYYKLSSSSSWSYKTTTSTAYTFSNTDLNGGTYYNFKVQAYNYINSEGWYSTETSTKSIYTPPRALGVTPTIYCDDAMGTVVLKWTNPTGRSDIGGINIYVDNGPNPDHSNYAGYISSYTNGATVTKVVTIPNYKRGSGHWFYLESYHNLNSGETQGPTSSVYLGTSSGSLKINGTTYSCSTLKNVTTYQKTITNGNSNVFKSDRTVYLGAYSMGMCEVTQELFSAVMGYNPSQSSTGNYYPVEYVSWYEAIAFCNKLSALQGLTPCYTISGISDWANITKSSIPTSSNSTWNNAVLNQSANGYHLPTEAQWEFAARGGTVGGTQWDYKYSGSNTCTDVGWADGKSGDYSKQVATKNSNILGLYDMTGNVYEWTSDWNYSVPSGSQTNPWCGYSTSLSGSNLTRKDGDIMLKGGSWQRGWSYVEVKRNDYHNPPQTKDKHYGFRICRNVTFSE